MAFAYQETTVFMYKKDVCGAVLHRREMKWENKMN